MLKMLNDDEAKACPFCGKPYIIKHRANPLDPSKYDDIPVCDCDCAENIRSERESRHLEEIRERTNLNQRITFAIDDRKNPTASDMCMRFVKHFSELLHSDHQAGLFIYGNIGTGKSFLAQCIGNALLDKGFAIETATLDNLVAEATKGYGENRDDVTDRLKHRDLFIIDDFGIERSSDYMNTNVYTLIDTRYRSGKPTIVTSNFSPSTLNAETDTGKRRIYSRILAMCSAGIKLDGEDRRKKAANENTKWLRNILTSNEHNPPAANKIA